MPPSSETKIRTITGPYDGPVSSKKTNHEPSPSFLEKKAINGSFNNRVVTPQIRGTQKSYTPLVHTAENAKTWMQNMFADQLSHGS